MTSISIHAPETKAYRRSRLLLFIATWIVYAMTSDGSLSVDPLSRWDVSETVARSGSVALPVEGQHTLEREGRHYSVFLPGQSIEFLPFAITAVLAERVFGIDAETASFGGRFLACTLYVPFICALAVLGHLAVVRRLGVPPRLALLSGALVAFATPLWVWGTRGSEEPTIAALTMWAFAALLDCRALAQNRSGADDVAERGRRFADGLGRAGVLLAFGLVHRSPFATICIGALVMALPMMVRNRDLLRAGIGRFMGWTTATAVILAIVPVYNAMRFGDPLEVGYAAYFEPMGGLWETPLMEGVYGLLLSPGKGALLFAPWLLLLPIALSFPATWRRLGPFARSVSVILVLHVLIYGMHTFWHGAFGWGVRFNVSLMPLLLVPITVWLAALEPGRIARALLACLAAISVAVQLAGGCMNWGLEMRQHPEGYGIGDGVAPEERLHRDRWKDVIPVDAAWTWQGSQLRQRFANIADKLRGRPLLEGVADDDPAQIVAAWNLFPLRASWGLDSRAIIVALWVLWALLALELLTVAVVFARTWRRLPA